MTPRQTKKFVKAQEVAKMLGINPRNLSHDDLYAKLEKQGFFWKYQENKWRIQQQGEGDSEFEDDRGNPSGIFKLRITAHRNEVEAIARQVTAILEREGLPLEHLEGPRPNRRGIGYTMYYVGQKKK
jgi:hypothetical protein